MQFPPVTSVDQTRWPHSRLWFYRSTSPGLSRCRRAPLTSAVRWCGSVIMLVDLDRSCRAMCPRQDKEVTAGKTCLYLDGPPWPGGISEQSYRLPGLLIGGVDPGERRVHRLYITYQLAKHYEPPQGKPGQGPYHPGTSARLVVWVCRSEGALLSESSRARGRSTRGR